MMSDFLFTMCVIGWGFLGLLALGYFGYCVFYNIRLYRNGIR